MHGFLLYDTLSFQEGTCYGFSIVSGGHQSIFKATQTENQFVHHLRLEGLSQLSDPPDETCLFRVNDHLNVCRFKQHAPAVVETWDITVFTHWPEWINTLRPRQNGRHLADDIFKWIFVTENVWPLINISLKFVPMVQINNIAAFVQKNAWCRPGDEPIIWTNVG